MSHETFVGSCDMLIRVKGSNDPFVPVATVSKLDFEHEEETKELRANKGLAKVGEVKRLTGVKVKITAHSFKADDLVRVLRGTKASIVAGAATDEPITVAKGGLIRLAHLNPSAVVVKDDLAAIVPATEYEVRPAGIYFPADSTLVNGDEITVSYSYPAQETVEALVNSGLEYEMVADGLNEADSGKPFVVDVWRLTLGILSNLPLMGDDFAEYEIEGAVLADLTKAVGKSQYYRTSAVVAAA